MIAPSLTEIITRRAKALAYVPDAVSVVEQRREDRFLLVYIYPGTAENAGAIIGKGGANIEELRRYAESDRGRDEDRAAIRDLAKSLNGYVFVPGPLRHRPATTVLARHAAAIARASNA